MPDQRAAIRFTAEDSWVVRLVRDVLKEHGTDLLLPADEFDCCAEEIVLALRNNGAMR